MGWASLLALALALAMDAFAVAVVAGVALKAPTGRHVFRLAFHFGLFQGLMLAGGWYVGSILHASVASSDHWLAFAVLAFVGGRMIWSATHAPEAQRPALDPTAGWDLVLLSVATSVDALAVGLSLAIIGSQILFPAMVVGVIACLLTLVGMLVGKHIGLLWGERVEIFGGLVLIGIGVRIVWQHVMV